MTLKKRLVEPSSCTHKRYLETQTNHYYSFNYYSMYSKDPEHPSFLNILKNDTLQFSEKALKDSSDKLKNCLETVLKDLQKELPDFFGQNNPPLICLVPRAKRDIHYSSNQLIFKKTIKELLNNQDDYEDGTEYIIRTENVITTHARNFSPTFQSQETIKSCLPILPGVTRKTCRISEHVKDKNIILIDDIYTGGVNIDEDAIQALYDSGAKNVVLYTVGYTIKKGQPHHSEEEMAKILGF